MKLIIGLGNPGKEYEKTRHNVGFQAIDLFASKHNLLVDKEKFNGLFVKRAGYILAKPLTYMNLSGDFVLAIAQFFKIDLVDILIIYDDLDLPLGKIKVKPTGSSGGHNGVKSIISAFGNNQEIARVKIGIAKNGDTIGHVLGKFTKAEQKVIDNTNLEVCEVIETFLNNGLQKTMNKFNKKSVSE
jgi:PTH1 family peptidyl-tRNA hydrolase